MRQEAKEIKQLIQAANGSLSLRILEEAASVEADHDATEWDNYWTPWWQRKGAEQVPPELTADQVLSAKKVATGNIEERGVYEVVKREVMEQTPGATMLSVKWVLTNKGTPEAPAPKTRLVAREFASNALDRDTLLGHARSGNGQKPDLQGSYVQVIEGETEGHVTRRDGGFLVR